jgi:DNA processing protein
MAWLIARLSGHLERHRGRLTEVLALPPAELMAAVAGDHRRLVERELGQFEAELARLGAEQGGVETICRHDRLYPGRLGEVAHAPAVLHVAGGLERFLELVERDPVAIVGSRRPSAYGTEVATSLGRDLAVSGLTVISGMALGIDSAAHSGALSAGEARTVAVLPRGADRPYPPAKRALYREILRSGVAVSELPPGAGVRRWSFPARNRIIAGLANATVVVEAGARSGALFTAAIAHDMGRAIGAVPGRVTSPTAAGSNDLIARRRAFVVRGAQDVLDAIYGAGTAKAKRPRRGGAIPRHLRGLLAAVGDGLDTAGALGGAGMALEEALVGLAELELHGHVRRGAGGRYVVVA